MGAWERSGRFAAQPGLNGMTFIQKEYPNIYDATQWLRTEAAKNPDFKGTILEAQQDEYRDWTIFSTFSGFPTVIGWGTAHVLLWRSGTPAQYNDATQRVLDVDEIYATKDITRAKELISRYNIKYVVVGPFETGLKNPSAPDNKPPKKYEAVALAKFASFMKVVYNQNGVTIYE
jgi:uncharacterized membrane protein